MDPSPSLVEVTLDNITNDTDITGYLDTDDISGRSGPIFPFLAKWILRLTCIFITLICPWANYKLVQLFQTRPFHKESSAKWYIIFKAIFDTSYIIVSIPMIFFLTFNVDLIHRNVFTCKLIIYLHYLADDLISLMFTLLCIDRMIRITCGYHLRTCFSLIICLIVTGFFMIMNIHHLIRLQHRDGFCQRKPLSIGDYDFDIYYPIIYTLILWTIIFIVSINVTLNIYCDRAHRMQLKKRQQQQEQEQNLSKIFLNGSDSTGLDSDRIGLIHSTGNN